MGNVLSVTDPRGGVVTTTYDALNRPVAVTDEVGATTTTTYDAVGRVASTTDPAGVVKKLTYDPRGLLTATTENYVAGEEPSASVNVTTLRLRRPRPGDLDHGPAWQCHHVHP